MSDKKEMRVQAFVNVMYNHEHDEGQQKFAWGFGWFDLGDKANPLSSQIMDRFSLSRGDTFNLNVTAFTPVLND